MSLLNECLECGHITEMGLWKIEGVINGVKIEEYFIVKPDLNGDFDLTSIDYTILAKKYNVPEDDILDLVGDGEACCPVCKSTKFFIV